MFVGVGGGVSAHVGVVAGMVRGVAAVLVEGRVLGLDLLLLLKLVVVGL